MTAIAVLRINPAAPQQQSRLAGFETNGHFTWVNVSVSPLTHGPSEAPLFLVVLEEVADPAPKHVAQVGHGSGGLPTKATARIVALEQELRTKNDDLRSAHEQLECSNQDLRSSNEEMASVNEELQSTNEELETSKEELQSVNEELTTVNAELNAKVSDLSRINSDMNNLLAGTGIATVFVDHHLRIMRFTPTAREIVNVIPGDVGRPLAHIVSNLTNYNELIADAQGVLDTLIPADREVQAKNGQWFLLRIRPYRTLDNVIDGVVLTFMDISAMKENRAALHKANELARLAVVVRDATDAITVQDLDGRILAWNPAATRTYGWSEDEALHMNVRDRIPRALREDELAKIRDLSRAAILEPYTTQRVSKDGVAREVSVVATALVDETGHVYAIATTERIPGPGPDQTGRAIHGKNG